MSGMGKSKRAGESSGPADKPKLSKGAQDRIGRELRAYYQDLVDEPLPDKLQALIESLGTEEQSGATAGEKKKAKGE